VTTKQVVDAIAANHKSPGFETADFIAASLPFLPPERRKDAERLILRNLIAGLRAKGDPRR
jgi:hypothetical protein